jgi:hypothetical protein
MKPKLILMFIFGLIISLLYAFNRDEKPTKSMDISVEQRNYGGGYDDIVEEYYKDLLSKNADLKKLEEDVKAFKAKRNDLYRKFDNYHQPSSEYYLTAKSKIDKFANQELKKRILDQITKSEEKYQIKKQPLEDLLTVLKAEAISLEEHYTALKIIKTIPLIESHQERNLPTKELFQDAVKEQAKWKEEIIRR